MAAYDHLSIPRLDTGNVNRLRPSVRLQLEHPEKDQSQFLAFTRRAGTVKIPQFSHRVQFDWDPNRLMRVTVAASISATALTVDDATNAIDGDVYAVIDANRNPTGEHIYIDADGSGTSLGTIVRGTRGTTAVAIAADSLLQKLYNIRADDDTYPASRVRAPGEETQYATFLAKDLKISLWAQKADYYGVDEMARIDAQGLRDFAKDRESNLLFSAPSAAQMANSDGTTVNAYSTGGWHYHATRHNYIDCMTELTHDTFVRGVQQMNRLWGKADKVAMMSDEMAAGISKWGLKHNMDRREMLSDKFGFAIDSLVIPGHSGNIDIVISYMFEGRNEIGIMDFRGLKVMQHMPVTIDRGPDRKGIQVRNRFRTEWGIYVAEGLMCTMPQAQGVFGNIRRVVA